MFTVEGMRKFHHWTHLSLDLVLEHLSALAPSDYVMEVSGFGFPSLREQAIHIFNCEGFWFHLLQGLPYTDRTAAHCPSAADVKRLQSEVSYGSRAYLSKLTDRELNGEMELRFPDGDVAVRSPALVLHHVLTHAFHHKGQIAAMCRALGHPLSDSDLNRFE